MITAVIVQLCHKAVQSLTGKKKTHTPIKIKTTTFTEVLVGKHLVNT